MSLKINWNFNNYSDVESVVICRSNILDNEKAFEDALNGESLANAPTIINSISASSLTPGSQSYTDIVTLDPNTTYYYCVAAKGTGSNGLYKVGPTTADASTTAITNSGNGNSSVARFVTGAGSTTDLLTVQEVKYINASGTEVAQNQLVSNQDEINTIIASFQSAVDYLKTYVSLPTGAASHRVTLNLCENFEVNTASLAEMESSNLYTVDGNSSSTFGNVLTRDGNLRLNVPKLITAAHQQFNDILYNVLGTSITATRQMDPGDPNFYLCVILHELLHMLGCNGLVAFSLTNGAPIQTSGEGADSGWVYTGLRGLKEYKRYVQAYEENTDPLSVADVYGVPVEDAGSTATVVQAHFDEGPDIIANPWDGYPSYFDQLFSKTAAVRTINNRNHWVPAYSTLSTINSLQVWEWDLTSTQMAQEQGSADVATAFRFRAANHMTRLDFGILEDIGYTINWNAVESRANDWSPVNAKQVNSANYPYPA